MIAGGAAILRDARKSALLRMTIARVQPSIVETGRSALGLDVAAALFALQPALLRAEGRLGWAARRRPHHRLAQEFEQAIDGVGAVALLGAETLGMNHDHAVLGHTASGEPVEPISGIGSKPDPAGIEAQLRRGRELVDVLPARPGGADEGDLDVVLVD